MQLGFVIDQEACIGCHACTVACKAENDVPVGSFRTWVKYVEEGTFPDVKRHMLVQRCNHCSDAPCVTICPVNALEKREDGIVDLDRDACIGCRACMQACPYDALYLNEDLGAVEKCHFCAHRVEKGLEPACAVVCPVNAIIAGDMDDPNSRPGAIIESRQTTARRPEQGTGPNVRYVAADDLALQPGAAARPELYMWSDRPPDRKPEPWPEGVPLAPHAVIAQDTEHKVEWGWPVSLYLVTKGIAAGAAMLAGAAAWLGLGGGVGRIGPEIIALTFTAITCLLLVEDLARPMRFYRMMTRPNFRSWLVRGAVVLGVFGVLVAAALAVRMAGHDRPADAVRWLGALAGIGAAGYTALLFGQCKGRDLWESPLLLPHLIVQAVFCGAATLLPLAAGSWAFLPGGLMPLRVLLIAGAIGHAAFAVAERRGRHATANARQAAGFLGEVRVGGLLAYRDGLLLAVAGTIVFAVLFPALAVVPAMIGLYLYEHAYVRAGQLPPLS